MSIKHPSVQAPAVVIGAIAFDKCWLTKTLTILKLFRQRGKITDPEHFSYSIIWFTLSCLTGLLNKFITCLLFHWEYYQSGSKCLMCSLMFWCWTGANRSISVQDQSAGLGSVLAEVFLPLSGMVWKWDRVVAKLALCGRTSGANRTLAPWCWPPLWEAFSLGHLYPKHVIVNWQ